VAGEEENVIVLVQQVAHVGYRCERGRDGELRARNVARGASPTADHADRINLEQHRRGALLLGPLR
jgi:hypothetical protein